jgi:hypothetical protein
MFMYSSKTDAMVVNPLFVLASSVAGFPRMVVTELLAGSSKPGEEKGGSRTLRGVRVVGFFLGGGDVLLYLTAIAVATGASATAVATASSSPSLSTIMALISPSLLSCGGSINFFFLMGKDRLFKRGRGGGGVDARGFDGGSVEEDDDGGFIESACGVVAASC